MKIISQIQLYVNTIKYLRYEQIVGRFMYVIKRNKAPNRVNHPAVSVRAIAQPFVLPIEKKPSMLGPTNFIFLNKIGDLTDIQSWNRSNLPKLWLYNLHYFDDLNAESASVRRSWHLSLLRMWIRDNPPGAEIGWDSYPISIRVVNWIKWALAGNEVEADIKASLAEQVFHLESNIEWHLLGNHLWTNAKALIFAGCFFAGKNADRWLKQGLNILERQLTEQILNDGGHFELSPMYHAIILEDILDLLNIGRTYGSISAPVVSRLCDVAGRMRRWLEIMTHPDGQIAFFNDCAVGIAAEPSAINRYGQRLGLGLCEVRLTPLEQLSSTGYFRLNYGKTTVFFDAAAVGPDYLPGHAHADTLSLELSLENERIIVNGGTSVYEDGDTRRRQRSTAAHSTVIVDGANSSEVWSSFRVARRARVSKVGVAIDADSIVVSCSHDGYMRLRGRNVHGRSIRVSDSGLQVEDLVSGNYDNAVAHFHLGEGVWASEKGPRRRGTLRTRYGRNIEWVTSSLAEVVADTWHPEFGIEIPTLCLIVPLFEGFACTEFRIC